MKFWATLFSDNPSDAVSIGYFFDNFVKSWLVLSRLPMQLQRRLGPSCGSLVSICPNPTDFDISLTFLVFYLFKMIFGSFDVIWCHLMSFDVIWCHLMSFVSIWNVICLFLATGKWDREAHISPDALRDLQASVSALGTAHVVSASRESRDMSSTSHWSLLKLTETWGPVLAWARRGFKIWVLVDGYQMTARF